MRCLTAVVLSAVTASSAAAEQPVRIYVFGRTPEALAEPERKARLKETDTALERAEQGRKNVQKSLAARHGKNGQNWPEEARRELEAAQRGEYDALLAHHQLKVDEGDLRGLAGSLGQSLLHLDKKTGRLALAPSADQADLSVEVLTRRAKTSFPAAAWFVYVKVKPERPAEAAARAAGATVGPASGKSAWLGQIMGNQRLRGSVTTMHSYSETEPYWIIEVAQQGTSYGLAIDSTAEVVAALASGLAEPAAEGAAARANR